MFGVISKTEKFDVNTSADKLRAEHYRGTRAIYDGISQLSQIEIERLMIAFFRDPLTHAERGRIAWQVLAWNALFTPFKHPNRAFYLNTAPFIAELRKHPEKVYLFAVFVLEHPNEEIYEYVDNLPERDLRNLYQRYCVMAHERVIYLNRGAVGEYPLNAKVATP